MLRGAMAEQRERERVFYWKSTCSTCRDARNALRARGLEAREVNYAKAALAPEVVEAIVMAAGSVTAVLNGRHAIAKEKGWAATPPSAGEFARAVEKEPNLLRRPILLVGGKAIVGFDREAYARL
jgi:arsenate reductase-like glutaredoxin family protein